MLCQHFVRTNANRPKHFLLQRLPQMPTLRSLNIPFVADHVTPNFDPKELALQIVDIVALRPEVELCYLGISHKCFEILETRRHDERRSSSDSDSSGMGTGPDDVVVHEEEDDDDEGTDDDDEGDLEDDLEGDLMNPINAVDPEETESDLSDVDDSDDDSFSDSDTARCKPRLRLREILFYDDKIAIFKARHGRI